MVNFYDKYINCYPSNVTVATLSQVAGKGKILSTKVIILTFSTVKP